MFHIFFVNKGYMLVLEPPALGSVYDLQKYIADSTNVDVHDQFLFLSGGVSLVSNTMLSAVPGGGTDTNPIFLVKRVSNVQPEPERVNADGINELYQGWTLGLERLDRIGSNSPTAITECIDLGKKCAQVAEMIFRFCDNIISEHQYLHQGWMAVISNLDDNIQRIQRRLDRSRGQAEKLETIREKGRTLLNEFDKVLSTLAKIVIPPTLLTSPSSAYSAQTALCDSDGSAEEMTLFDWISSKDPDHSLNSLAQHVMDHLEKTDDSDLREAQQLFANVMEVTTKSQYRDIGGIDKRLAMLNTKLQHLKELLAKVKEVTARIVQPIIQDSAQNVAIWQKSRLSELRQPLKSLYDFALCFINSKHELVKNISQRLGTWIRQAYQRLNEVNKRVVLFEEKFDRLRKRLDLARQIKEAPNIYMTAVPEVIRRESLKKDFNVWICSHIEKCAAFIGEENRIRDEFQSKLDRHFLRLLFIGMNDKIPQFTAQSPPKIDDSLPRVAVSHLIELRKAFPDMKELLSVGTPRVFVRLAVTDPNIPPALVQSQMRREESFYARDKTSNMDAMNRNFPSTNWLSEENMEISPSIGPCFMTMARGASNSSLNSIGMASNVDLQSPQELGPLSEHFSLTANSSSSTIVADANRASMSPLQPSAPITIPFKEGNDPMESLGSNHFSTPDEFGSLGSACGSRHTPAHRGSFPSQPLVFRCSPKITRPLSLVGRNHQQHVGAYSVLPEEKEMMDERISKQNVLSLNFGAKLVNAQNQLKELNEDLCSVRQMSQQLSESIANPSVDISQIRKGIEELVGQQKNGKVGNEEAEAERQEKEKEANELKAKMEQLEKELEKERQLNAEKEGELADKQKMVDRQNDALTLMMKERDELAEALKQREEAILALQREKEAENATMLADVSAQELSQAIGQSVIEVLEEVPIGGGGVIGSDEEEGISPLCSRTCGTQTKIRCKELLSFVSLGEIFEGFGALIIWNPQMNAFMAHCTVPKQYPYIVKDSCLDRLGIRRPRALKPSLSESQQPSTSASVQPVPQQQPQRTWAFVLVENIELCQIRKTANRYNLPLDSRFFRMSVQPMPGEFSSAMSSASSVASSRR